MRHCYCSPRRSGAGGRGGAYLAAWARCSRFCVATSAPSPTPSLPADQLDPEAPALPQLYGDKDGHLLLVFLEDAARLLFTDDSHVTGFKASAPKAKQKKRGRGRAEEVNKHMYHFLLDCWEQYSATRWFAVSTPASMERCPYSGVALLVVIGAAQRFGRASLVRITHRRRSSCRTTERVAV